MRMYDYICIIYFLCFEYFIVLKNVFDKFYKLLLKVEMIKMKFNNKKSYIYQMKNSYIFGEILSKDKNILKCQKLEN